MKKLVILAAITLMMTAFANKSTVNILISNAHDTDTTNVAVQVPIDLIMQHIDTESVDSLILLNEKNQKVDFTITHGNQDIEFIVPVVKARSQKNYSLNTNINRLSDNIFSFRTTNISVNL